MIAADGLDTAISHLGGWQLVAVIVAFLAFLAFFAWLMLR